MAQRTRKALSVVIDGNVMSALQKMSEQQS